MNILEDGQTFSDNSSSEQFNTKFQLFCRQAECQFLNFSSNNFETYNNLFSLKELTSAISKSHYTAVGADDTQYQLLKNLSNSAMDTLFNFLNNIWLSRNFPPSWCTSTDIPVLKPGKEESDPGSYRSFALTSCVLSLIHI